MIITTAGLQNNIASLKNWKEFLGYSVKVVNISWISSTYPGKDLPEKIRNFLIDKYEEWRIKYVLIVGSRNTIPMRECAPDPYNHEDHQTDHLVPSDYYYADLTGEWDADKDGYYGEYMEDNMDFYPEVYVGRIPSDNAEEVKDICQAIINYECNQGDWKKNALLLGAIAFYKGMTTPWGTWPRIDGATLMEECCKDIFKPNGCTVTKMYEMEGIKPSNYSCDYPLNRDNVLAEWTKGYGMVNMLGHGNERVVCRLVWESDNGDNIPERNELKYPAFLSISDAKDISCHRPPIVFSCTCDQLYSSFNMGKSFITKQAAVAFIGFTGMSWYNITRKWNDESDGGVESISYYFFHYLANEKQGCGEALYNSKVYYYEHFGFEITQQNWDDAVLRFYSNLYGCNLYGDPSLGIYTKKTDTEAPLAGIQQPKGHLYIGGKEIMPTISGNSIIIGNITINVSATDNLTGIDKVEFYIDDELKASLSKEPYEWLWDEKIIGKHTIKVVAYDNAGNTASDDEKVLILSLIHI